LSPAFEHVTLDGDPEVELTVLEGHHLRVRTSGVRGERLEYEFDLRFADPMPVRSRSVPWAWMLAAAILVATGLGALLYAWPALMNLLGVTGSAWLILSLAAAAAGFVGLRWTVESLQLVSAHGRAPLVSVNGRLGSSGPHRKVFADLSQHVPAARKARSQKEPKFLRDEMREHYRLRELGVLSDKVYERSKAAILAAH
jgi:hypothetical protein